METDDEVRKNGLSQAGPELFSSPYIEVRRYIVCRNDEQAQKDPRDRQAIVEALRDRLKHGDKSLVGN